MATLVRVVLHRGSLSIRSGEPGTVRTQPRFPTPLQALTTLLKLRPMAWHLVQTSIDPPALDSMQRALRSSGVFPEVDAHGFVHDAFGVLIRDLEQGPALHLQAFLAAEGVSVEVVQDSEWPRLPPPKRIQQASCRADGFVPLDPLGRELVVPWDSIAAVACGLVQETDFGRRVTANVGFNLKRNVPPERLVLTGEERNWCWNAEVILAGGLRFTWKSHRFQPTPGSIPERREVPDFFAFIRDLVSHVPNAALNRGAFAIRMDQPDAGPRYPTRNAYDEEISWILFHLRRSGMYHGGDTAPR